MLTLVLGGPGCGKTTKVLDIIEEHLNRGVPPHRIAYLAFTTKAASEGRDRMCKKFDLDPDEIPFFRTIHSFAFRQLGMTVDQVMQGERAAQFARWSGLVMSEVSDEPGVIPMRTPDDRCMAALSLARLTRRPLIEVCGTVGASYRDTLRIEADLTRYKAESELVDFNDMLEHFIKYGDPPPLDVVIIDEAQDLSHLQWEVVEKVCRGVEDVYIAGDDDQAIYEWAGADVDYFLALKGKRVVLPTSYRLNRASFDVCQRIISNVENRFEKDWQPSREGGLVDRTSTIHDMDLTSGTWFVLARNFHHLKSLEKYLYSWGYPFKHSRKGSSIDNDRVTALLNWENLRKGGSINGGTLKQIWHRIKPHHRPEFVPDVTDTQHYSPADVSALGVDLSPDWMTALVMGAHERNYYREIKHRGESLVKEPRITVSSIHGVKGGEADHVLLATDMTAAVYANYLTNRAAEHRVFFVGASRARESLHIMTPRGQKHYPIESTA